MLSGDSLTVLLALLAAASGIATAALDKKTLRWIAAILGVICIGWLALGAVALLRSQAPPPHGTSSIPRFEIGNCIFSNRDYGRGDPWRIGSTLVFIGATNVSDEAPSGSFFTVTEDGEVTQWPYTRGEAATIKVDGTDLSLSVQEVYDAYIKFSLGTSTSCS